MADSGGHISLNRGEWRSGTHEVDCRYINVALIMMMVM